jgi:phosphate/sulfate permease
MGQPLDENQVVMRALALFLAVVVAFALGVQVCFGAGLLLGGIVFAALGWRLFNQVITPTQLQVLGGVAMASGLVALWAS